MGHFEMLLEGRALTQLQGHRGHSPLPAPPSLRPREPPLPSLPDLMRCNKEETGLLSVRSRARPRPPRATPGAHAPAMRPWLPCQRHLSFRLWRHLQVVTFLGCLSHSVVILFCINIRIFISALKLPQACQILTHKPVRLEPQRSQ